MKIIICRIYRKLGKKTSTNEVQNEVITVLATVLSMFDVMAVMESHSVTSKINSVAIPI